jgi:hypothetical protein
MSDADLSAEALAIIEVVAGAIRAELGEEVDAYPGRREPEGADPLNRAFRAVVRAILGSNTSDIERTHSLASLALRRVAGRRLTAEGRDDHRVKTLIDEEPGSPDDWLCFLILSSRAQIEPLRTPDDPDRA